MADNGTPAGRLWNFKRDARNRGITVRLTDAQALRLFEGDCYWCGRRGPCGIDRENNEPYYSTKNAVSCCWRCNRAKSSMTAAEWESFVDAVAKQFFFRNPEDVWDYVDFERHNQSPTEGTGDD
jgi:hypothetical protein